jgi:hypothetical protein
MMDRLKVKSKTWLTILTLVVGLSSCTEKPQIKQTEHGIEMNNLSFEINEIREIPWKVGQGFQRKVSKSLTVTIQLPHIAQDELDQLYDRLGVDSWVVRAVMIRNSSRQEIGSAFAPFKRLMSASNKRTNRASQIKSVSFSITYAAAAISERFRSFNCPAFSHNRRLEKYDIVGENVLHNLVVQPSEMFNDKPLLVELTPTVLNAGHQLVGDYYFDVGLYRSKDRRLFSRLIPLSQFVRVASEELVSIPECAGIHMENDPPKARTLPYSRR